MIHRTRGLGGPGLCVPLLDPRSLGGRRLGASGLRTSVDSPGLDPLRLASRLRPARLGRSGGRYTTRLRGLHATRGTGAVDVTIDLSGRCPGRSRTLMRRPWALVTSMGGVMVLVRLVPDMLAAVVMVVDVVIVVPMHDDDRDVRRLDHHPRRIPVIGSVPDTSAIAPVGVVDVVGGDRVVLDHRDAAIDRRKRRRIGERRVTLLLDGLVTGSDVAAVLCFCVLRVAGSSFALLVHHSAGSHYRARVIVGSLGPRVVRTRAAERRDGEKSGQHQAREDAAHALSKSNPRATRHRARSLKSPLIIDETEALRLASIGRPCPSRHLAPPRSRDGRKVASVTPRG